MTNIETSLWRFGSFLRMLMFCGGNNPDNLYFPLWANLPFMDHGLFTIPCDLDKRRPSRVCDLVHLPWLHVQISEADMSSTTKSGIPRPHTYRTMIGAVDPKRLLPAVGCGGGPTLAKGTDPTCIINISIRQNHTPTPGTIQTRQARFGQRQHGVSPPPFRRLRPLPIPGPTVPVRHRTRPHHHRGRRCRPQSASQDAGSPAAGEMGRGELRRVPDPDECPGILP